MKASTLLVALFCVMTGLFAMTGATQAKAATNLRHVPALERHGWQVLCKLGEDGFAANCYAEKIAGAYKLRVSAADSQIFVVIEHPQCQVDYQNFWREDLIGLTAKARYARINRAMLRIARDISKTCPKLPSVKLDLGYLPDVALADEGTIQ